MNMIASLTTIRNAALARAESSETVIGMHGYNGIANAISRVISDINTGSTIVSSQAIWGSLRIDTALRDEAGALASILEDLRDLGLKVQMPAA